MTQTQKKKKLSRGMMIIAVGMLVAVSGVAASHIGLVHSGLWVDIGLLLALLGLIFL